MLDEFIYVFVAERSLLLPLFGAFVFQRFCALIVLCLGKRKPVAICDDVLRQVVVINKAARNIAVARAIALSNFTSVGNNYTRSTQYTQFSVELPPKRNANSSVNAKLYATHKCIDA